MDPFDWENCLNLKGNEELAEGEDVEQLQLEFWKTENQGNKVQSKIDSQCIKTQKIQKPEDEKMTKSQLNKKENRYQKNICGYITKKITKELLSLQYKKQLEEVCNKYGANVQAFHQYYSSKINLITGPRHLPPLFVSGSPQQKPIKQAFIELFEWFLKERYIRYLLNEGKMENKQAYIRYKNWALYQIVQSHKKQEQAEK